MKSILLLTLGLLASKSAQCFSLVPRVIPTTTTRLSMADAGAEADDKKVVLITGASRGIGKCIAEELAKTGQVKLVINHIAPEKENADQTVEELKGMGVDAIAVEADCSQPEDIKKMFEEIREKYDHVDVLVNNAGITRDALTLRMKPEQWRAVIDINLSGVFFTSQEFLKLASKRKTGCVINIASISGQIGNPGQANYSSAKAGVIGLTKTHAKEFASRNIRVNAICPGFIATPMTAQMDPALLESLAKQIPLGRLGKPEEVAGMVKFLAMDPAAEYITGHMFNVDGGIAIGV